MFRTLLSAATLIFMGTQTPATAQGKTVFTLSGTALNASVAVSDTVAMVISDLGNNALHVSGTFANNTLFGAFRGNGSTAENCAPTHFCLHFDGVLENLQSGGFDPDTVTSFSMTLALSKDGKTAQGTYKTGVLPTYLRDQYGTLTLNGAGK